MIRCEILFPVIVPNDEHVAGLRDRLAHVISGVEAGSQSPEMQCRYA